VSISLHCTHAFQLPATLAKIRKKNIKPQKKNISHPFLWGTQTGHAKQAERAREFGWNLKPKGNPQMHKQKQIAF